MDLSTAVRESDLETIRAVLDAGADVRYVRPHGYTVLIDVLYSQSIREEEQLIPVLRLLIERGADLNVISDYGESALRVSSRLGWFEAVGVLLDAGADPGPLHWSPLHRAVALGTVADVRRRLECGDDLSARDWWERTPWLLSLQTRDVAKAELLLAAGADPNDRGRCGKPSLLFAAESNDPAVLRWLLETGVDPNIADEFGGTPLIVAAGNGDAECVRLLLDAGADPLLHSITDTPIRSASNLAVARMLVRAGADLADVNEDVRDEITKRRRSESIDCSREEYQAAKDRAFGTANPQLMNFPFWRAMVACGDCAYGARAQFEAADVHGPAVWCFDRFGKSFTELPDGRVIEIAGEHEDYCDQDFCIYNDVIVHNGDGTFDIYGYPRDVFPPTDFHTATLVGNSIYVIGNLGYSGERRFGVTQVYRLDSETLTMEPVETTGTQPGWIHRHRAKLIGNAIEVTGGIVCMLVDGEETTEDNAGRFLLDLGTMVWSEG
ncbi:ankyrin repeat domain-containing protein [Frigoriglobus tundricola]|uniref:Ankyrin n=1 Tax=Frigoriglobus tundricola TaxID=2774151 RepID=A0A6M5YHC8_9BACT|nr:ankyrin repeat domain-containing protein [Frigoriglobus tundricola]QJW93469.1 Ankyrin [Frigoriglobus tundricola]